MNEACIGCHKRLDPIAFAVNDYDTIGRVTGTPNHEAKRQLTARLKGASRTVARSFTRNLIAFSVGRDKSLLDAIAAPANKKLRESQGREKEILETYLSMIQNTETDLRRRLGPTLKQNPRGILPATLAYETEFLRALPRNWWVEFGVLPTSALAQ